MPKHSDNNSTVIVECGSSEVIVRYPTHTPNYHCGLSLPGLSYHSLSDQTKSADQIDKIGVHITMNRIVPSHVWLH